MDIDTSNATPIITYNSITVKKITISSISIDPLKRIANFTVSYWNGTVLLGNESYTYKATYIQPITPPVLKSLSVPSTTSYTITINATIGGTLSYTIPPFTSLFPYLTSGLTIYYSQIDPSMISLVSTTTSYNSMARDTRVIPNKYTYTGSFGTFVSLTNYASPFDNTGAGSIPYLSITNASYSFVDASNINIRVFYTVNDVQYSVIITQPTPSLLCRAGITTLYKNSGNLLSVTTDPINYNIPLQIGTNDTLNVKSEPNTTVSNPAIQTNMYDTIPIYKSVSALPSLSIYYNPHNISDISATNTSPYTQIAYKVFFTSVTFIKDSPTYQFTNLSYSTSNTSNATNVTFQSKQLTITSSQIEPAPIYCNPLNTADIGFQDDTKDKYDKLISIMTTTPTPTTTKISTLLNLFNTTINKTVTFDYKGSLSIQ